MGKGKAAKKSKKPKILNAVYEAELFRLQTEFVKLQEWTRHTGARVAVVFEGRDAAGKGGTIKRITEYLSPRVARIAALPAPNDTERGQWYYQRYVAELPAKGEIVLFDRSWYNRAGVEKVMGSARPNNIRCSCVRRRYSSRCFSRTASSFASTGSPCPTTSSFAGSDPAWTIRSGSGS